MLSVASRYLGRVDASDSKRGYLCSIVEKTTFLCSKTFALFTLCILLNAVICCSQLNTQRVLERYLKIGLLVIYAVGLRSMYFIVMPRVNLIVLLITFVRYLYSINCPTVICLPSMLLFILWRDTTSELWTPVHSFTLLLPFTIYLFYLHSCKLLPFTTRYA
jgi:hypothetical protein